MFLLCLLPFLLLHDSMPFSAVAALTIFFLGIKLLYAHFKLSVEFYVRLLENNKKAILSTLGSLSPYGCT